MTSHNKRAEAPKTRPCGPRAEAMMTKRLKRLFSIALACAFGLCLLLSPAARGLTEEAERGIRATLERSAETPLAAEERAAGYQIPFLGLVQGTILAVSHDLIVHDPETGAALERFPATVFFSESGRFLRVESEAKIDDPRRMAPETVEEGMRGGETTILGAADAGEDFDLVAFWNAVCRELQMAEATEFNLTAVLIQEGGADPESVIIVNAWGMDNPLDMPEGLPDVLKNRIRAGFDLEGNLLWMDNLL